LILVSVTFIKIRTRIWWINIKQSKLYTCKKTRWW